MANKRYACIGLFNPKSPENVGSVMRAAGCYGVASVFYTGKRYERARDFVTDTKKIHQDIPLIGIDDLKSIIPLGCIPVAVELVEGARALPEYTHPDRAIYIFGPEDGSLDKEIRDWCEDVVYIPTTGLHESGGHRECRALRPHGQRQQHPLRTAVRSGTG